VKPKRDWAEREVTRIQNMPLFTKERQLAAFVRVLRRARKLKEAERKAAEKRGYEQGRYCVCTDCPHCNAEFERSARYCETT
jgi:lipid A disaccharide synthetase